MAENAEEADALQAETEEAAETVLSEADAQISQSMTKGFRKKSGEKGRCTGGICLSFRYIFYAKEN